MNPHLLFHASIQLHFVWFNKVDHILWLCLMQLHFLQYLHFHSIYLEQVLHVFIIFVPEVVFIIRKQLQFMDVDRSFCFVLIL